MPLAEKDMMCYMDIHSDMSYTGQIIIDMTMKEAGDSASLHQDLSVYCRYLKSCVGTSSLAYKFKIANWYL